MGVGGCGAPLPLPRSPSLHRAFLPSPRSLLSYLPCPPDSPPAYLLGRPWGWFLGRGRGEGLTTSCGGGGCPPGLPCCRFRLRLGPRAWGRGSPGLPPAGPDPFSQGCQGQGPHGGPTGWAPHAPSHGRGTRRACSTCCWSSQEVVPRPDLEAGPRQAGPGTGVVACACACTRVCVCVGREWGVIQRCLQVWYLPGALGGPSCPGCLQPECLGSGSAHWALGKGQARSLGDR